MQPTPFGQKFERLEQLIRDNSVRSKINREGLHELQLIPRGPSPRDQVKRNRVKEWWLVRYVIEHHRKLGFSKVKGPFELGPDLQVKRRNQWSAAEVEIRWRGYLRHKHHLNKRFDACRFLIVLAEDKPPESAIADLPPEVIYIDRPHLEDWFDIACTEYAREHQPQSKLQARLRVIAGEMQGHWVEICPDRDRSMAVCPDCDGCPYFGEGSFQEATPAFWHLALLFAERRCGRQTKGVGNRYDLNKIDLARLEAFVEQFPPS